LVVPIHTEQQGGASPTWFLYSVFARNGIALFYVLLTRLSRSPLCAGHTNRKEPDADDLLAVFAASLKAARIKQGLTQAQLAERAGLLQQYVSLVEQGKQNVTLTTAQALARVLRLNVSDMLRGTAPGRPRR
jgi:DNA-binding XRE family transcriptional regulator